MCSSPIRILNKSCHYTPYFDKKYLVLPCGQCESCRLEQQNSWYVRLLAHYRDFPFVYVYTLTYKDFPTFTSKLRPEYRDIPCFNHYHIKVFLDNVRKYLLRKNVIGRGDMSYFVACEYGSDENHTHRPHYHVNLSFKHKIDYKILHDYVRQFWGDVHGIIYPDVSSKDKSSKWYRSRYPKESEILARSNRGAGRYISKYVTKDIAFFDNPKVKEFLNPQLKVDNPAEYKLRYLEIKRFLPKHWQSKGYGIALLNIIKNDGKGIDYYLRGGRWYDLESAGYSSSQGVKSDNLDKVPKYKVPFYILDKIKSIKCVYNVNRNDGSYSVACGSCLLRNKILSLTRPVLSRLNTRYYKNCDIDFLLRRNLSRLHRKYRFITYKTCYFIKFVRRNIKYQLNKYEDNIRSFIENVKSNFTYYNSLSPVFACCNNSAFCEPDLPSRLAKYIVFYRDREIPLVKGFSVDDIKLSKYFLNNFCRNRVFEHFNYADSSGIVYNNYADFSQLEFLSELFFNFFSNFVATSAKKCLDLQKFYKDCKKLKHG